MYKPHTQYIGFRTGQIINMVGGSQMVWIDNGRYWTIVKITGARSTRIGEARK